MSFKKILGTLLLTLAGFASSAHPGYGLPSAPTNIQAFYRSGQTFITWDEVPGANISYRVYRDVSQSSLVSPPSLGQVDSNSSVNTRASVEGNGQRPFRIVPGVDLPASRGLFVFTVPDTGMYYYAVTSVDGEGENLTTVIGQNMTSSALAETLGAPQPVPQGMKTYASNPREYYMYTRWCADYDTELQEAESIRPSLPRNFMLVKFPNSSSPHPMVLSLHAYGGNYFGMPGMPITGSGVWGEWILSLDDYLPNNILSTMWYGVNETFNWETGLPIPTSGLNLNITERYVLDVFNWATNTFASEIDANRIYASGWSMGGTGTAFIGCLALRDRIAGCFMTVPKLDLSFISEVVPGDFSPGAGHRLNCDRRWGTLASNLSCSDGMPVYDRLNYGLLIENMTEDLPPQVLMIGRNDTVVGWGEKQRVIAALQAKKQPHTVLWDSRTHAGTMMLPRTRVEWNPLQYLSSWLYDNQSDQPVLALSNSTGDGNLGINYDPVTADSFGTVNGNLRKLGTPIDLASKCEFGVGNRDLVYTLDTMYVALNTLFAPDSIWVDGTPRGLVEFEVVDGVPYPYSVRDYTTGALIDSGTVITGSDGLLTVPGILVTDSGARLTIYAPGPTGVVSMNPVFEGMEVFPNPSRGESSLRFRVVQEGEVTLGIFDASGRMVQTLRQSVTAGQALVPWNGRDTSGNSVANGVYLFRLSHENGATQTAKATLLR